MKALDVPTPLTKTHGQPTVSRANESTSRVAIRGWSALTPFGATRETWQSLLSGHFISDHATNDLVTGPGRAAQLALRVARDATAATPVSRDAALVVGTSKGSVEDWLSASPTPTGLADIAERVADTFNLGGPPLTVSAACASGLHALIR